MTSQIDQPSIKNQLGFLSATEEALHALIIQRTGIVLRDFQMPVLRQALAEACASFGYGGEEALLQELNRKRSSAPEFEFLLTRITIGESYFFRHTEQMALLYDELLPELIACKRRNRDCSLRVWSAGCSSGQEIYSLVIMLYGLLPDIDGWNLHFLATDINKNALADAIQGRYKEWSLRETPEAIAKKYFNESHGEYQLRDDICRRVKFAYLNLAEDAFPALHTDTNAIDIILCRNVFIYLEPESIQRIMQQFSECLMPNGLLFLGASDFVDKYPDELTHIQRGDFFYFKREFDECRESPAAQLNGICAIERDIAKNAPEIERGKERIAREQSTQLGGAFAQDPNLVDFLRAGRWHDTLLAVDKAFKTAGESVGLLQIKSKALANLGRLDEALQSCRRSLALNPVDKHIYLLQGTILLENAQPNEAEEAFRKAIFLDYTFPEAHYQLGLLLINQGERKMGLKCLSSALTYAKKQSPHHEVHNAPGMSYQRLVEIIQNEMSVYAGDASRIQNNG